MTEAAIADHGMIGDLQTAALVGTDGSVDWFCCPRFDSPSVFGALLDDERGGRVRPGRAYESKQMYFPDTAVLITRFITEAGLGEVVDFMPPTGRVPTGTHRLARMLRCVRGSIGFEINIASRFDYGRRAHRTELTRHGAVFGTDALTLTLHAVREPDDARLAQVRVEEGDVRVSMDLVAGDVRGVVLESAADGPPREIRRWREMLQRSAITLKLMTYAPTGGLVAAPTTGLPEQVGGERNWDYRYTWVRDASFSVYALLRMGFTEEAAQFSGWLRDRAAERVGDEGGPLNIMYRVDGSADLKEETLPHWSGYRGSRPVRIGNGASDQLQLDIYGEALDSIYFADARGLHGRPAAVDRWRGARDTIYEQIMTKGWDAERKAFVQHYGSAVLDSSLLTDANHVGLFSEEIAPTGEQIGNFPQAFTHLALVDAAITLDEALDRAADPATKDRLGTG